MWVDWRYKPIDPNIFIKQKAVLPAHQIVATGKQTQQHLVFIGVNVFLKQI
jgi:hypothetical protein